MQAKYCHRSLLSSSDKSARCQKLAILELIFMHLWLKVTAKPPNIDTHSKSHLLLEQSVDKMALRMSQPWPKPFAYQLCTDTSLRLSNERGCKKPNCYPRSANEGNAFWWKEGFKMTSFNFWVRSPLSTKSHATRKRCLATFMRRKSSFH